MNDKSNEKASELVERALDAALIDQAEIIDREIVVATVAALEAKLSKMEELRVEVENVIGMAHSFANFPSWLEQLEKALAGGEEA